MERKLIALLSSLVVGVPAAGSARADEIVALTTDFSSGAIATIAPGAPCSAAPDLAAICSDPVGRAAFDRLFVVGRFGCDAIQVLDPFASYATVHEFSVGPGSNPQDIAVITPTRAYVSFYETNDLREVNPQTGATLGSISLAGFADPDGTAEAHRMFVRGRHLFVQLQRLDRSSFPYVPVAPSMLAVIDLDTRTVVDVDPSTGGTQAIELTLTNPIAPMQVDLVTGDLLVPCAGAYGVSGDGGVERVDLSSLEPDGVWLPGSELDGDLVDFCQWSGTRAYAIVADLSFNTSLVHLNPTSGVLTGTTYAPGGYVLSDCLTHHDGRIFLSDRDFFDPGVRVFDAATGVALCGPVSTGLPPFELFVRPDFPSDVAGDGARARIEFAAPPWPNPATGPVTFSFRGPVAGARLDVADVAGRRVWTSAVDPAGIRWDGRDERGEVVASGRYYARVVAPDGSSSSAPLTLIR